MSLFDIRNLTIELTTQQGTFKAVDRVNLRLNAGEFKGLVGESGSGKSLIAKAILGITNDSWRVTADRFYFDGQNLLNLSQKKRQKIVSDQISMIFQEAKAYLDPTMKIGRLLQLAIPSKTFKGHWRDWFFWRKRRSIELLHRVGIKDHKTIMNAYAGELSEGECQKIMIAMALATQPKLLIADEPTHAMEANTAAQIFRLLASLNKNYGMTVLLISHDLRGVMRWCDRIHVLYCGQTVEEASTESLIETVYHPYTQSLMTVMPNVMHTLPHKSPLNTLPGTIPALDHLPMGCRLGPRCRYAQKKCIYAPELRQLKDHSVACYYPLNLDQPDEVLR